MIRKNLPNLLTLANLSLGVLAILVAASTDKISLQRPGDDISLIYFSCLFVMAAAVFDRFDGKLARKLDWHTHTKNPHSNASRQQAGLAHTH